MIYFRFLPAALRWKSFTSSTTGITRMARARAVPYSIQPTGVKPKALATGSTSSTKVVMRRLPSMAAHRTLLWLRVLKMLRRWKRILKLWNTSHILMVKKAMVIPWGDTPLGISKYPTSTQWPMI